MDTKSQAGIVIYGIELYADPDGLPNGAVWFREGRSDRSVGNDAEGYICVDSSCARVASKNTIGFVQYRVVLYIAGLSPIHDGEDDKGNFKGCV